MFGLAWLHASNVARDDHRFFILAEVGFVAAPMVRGLPDSSLQIVEGHLRAETTPDSQVHVLVVDLSDQKRRRSCQPSCE